MMIDDQTGFQADCGRKHFLGQINAYNRMAGAGFGFPDQESYMIPALGRTGRSMELNHA